MYKMKLNIGDWSDDGHGKCESYIYEVNYPVDVVQQAYKDSCKLAGVQFNHSEDYTGGKCIGHRPWNQIATEYDANEIDEKVYEVLQSFGIQVDRYVTDLYIENFNGLWWEFVKLSKPDLEYKDICADIPNINGYWNGGLNVQFGYGLFY